MVVSEKRVFLSGFALVLLIAAVLGGCSGLPWSKSKDKAELPEGRTVYIEDLEESKGINRPASPEKEPPRTPPAEPKPETPRETQGEKKEVGTRVGLTPSAPPDLTFSPVKKARGLKRKICVLDVQGAKGFSGEKYAELAALRLYQELERSQKAVLVDKAVLRQALEGKGIESEELTEPQGMKTAHQLLGIQAFLVVSIADLDVTSSPPVGDSGEKSSMASARLERRFIDASTGNLLRTFIGKNPAFTSVATGLHSDDRSIAKAIDDTISQVLDGVLRYLDFLEWSSTVARVEDGKVYVQAGRLTGLRPGVTLDVYEPGEEIINPVTKFSLGWTTGRRRGKVVVTGLFGVDAAIAEPVNGAGFMPNDIVKISRE
jgi:hypothetical protein